MWSKSARCTQLSPVPDVQTHVEFYLPGGPPHHTLPLYAEMCLSLIGVVLGLSR